MIVTAAWTYLSPLLGPVWLWARQSIWLAPIFNVFRAWRLVLGGAGVFAVVAAAVWLAWPDERVTMAEAKQLCEDTIARAELAKTKEALVTAQRTLETRRVAIETAESWIESMSLQLEVLRAQAPDPDAPVFAADDPWMRKRSAR